MLNDPPNLNCLWAALIVEELIRNGVDTFCVSPGSRSAPLAMAVATGGQLQHYVHHDERAMAYFALGHAKATGRPAVFICTSGTAAANALPAVAEASQSNVPLILLTADRPPELQDCGANQTMPQERLYGDFVRWRHSFPCPTLDVPPEYVLTTVDQAIHRATRAPAGPVHLNCAYREPLAPDRVDFDLKAYTQSLASWFDGPFTYYTPAASVGNSDHVSNTLSMLRQEKRGLIIAGQLSSREEIEAARTLAETTGWPLLPDATSSLRFGDGASSAVHHYDILLESHALEHFNTSSVMLHVGGAIVSKRLQKFVAATPSRYYVRVADHALRLDPQHRVTHRLEMGLEEFVRVLKEDGNIRADTDWVDDLRGWSQGVDKYIEEALAAESNLNEIGIVRAVTQQMPSKHVLFLGNSLPIREADTFGASSGSGMRVMANRGVSGIDGNVATVAGLASALGNGVTAILGDLSALHDITSLGLFHKSKTPIVLVILNNDGGGIFSFLPIAEHEEHFETFFGTPHGRSFVDFARAFEIEYFTPNSSDSFRDCYRQCLEKNATAVIEVKTDRRENEAVHRRVLRHVWDRLNSEI